jgi:class 3 adenylate cyclase
MEGDTAWEKQILNNKKKFMGKFLLSKKDITPLLGEEENIGLINKDKLDLFNPRVLGLGDINSKSVPTKVLAAIFDLQGFTNFCSQDEPELIIPGFLNTFLNWLFLKIRNISIDNNKNYSDRVAIYFQPPFISKFVGDGILFLWDTEDKTELEINNIVTSCHRIWMHYKDQFLPTINDKFNNLPQLLRCGIARGTVYSVGDKKDYVGPCINLASRLQKLNSLTFAFSRKGINFEKYMPENRKEIYCVKKVDIRGIGSELVCVLKDEFNHLPENEKEKFK